MRNLDLCEEDLACLWSELEKRWVALGQRIEEVRGVGTISGLYEYVSRPEEVSGDLIIAAGHQGHYGFRVLTVNLDRGHICEAWSGNARLTHGGVVSWLDLDTGLEIQIVPSGNGILVLRGAHDEERRFCGVRAHFLGSYRSSKNDGN